MLVVQTLKIGFVIYSLRFSKAVVEFLGEIALTAEYHAYYLSRLPLNLCSSQPKVYAQTNGGGAFLNGFKKCGISNRPHQSERV